MNLVGVYRTGWPARRFAAGAAPRPDEAPYSEGGRLPGYQRIDLKISRRFDTSKGAVRPFFEVTNLLDRRNICCLADIGRFAESSGHHWLTTRGHWRPFTPAAGVVWSWAE